MTTITDSSGSPSDRVEDVPRILRALTTAVREALLRHKQAGHPVAVWRNGRVAWVAPSEIPSPEPEAAMGGK